MRKLHLISHTHWDREWYRTFQQFRLKLVHLVDGLLDILEQDKLYKHFMLDGQTIILEDYLLMRPEKEEVIRKFIQKGRLIIGPWYILPDEFLVSPEATIRNLLQGDRICSRFGYKMMVGYEPDTFGHIGQLPQILRGFGFDTACLWRGAPDLPSEVWWEAPDGSRVFTAHMREGYGNAAGLPTSNPDEFLAEVKRLQIMLAEHSISGEHLLLMHGTDHMEPPADTTAAIGSTRGKLEGAKLIHSTLPDYLASVRASLKGKELPVMKGELRECKRAHLLPGVLSTRMWIKQRNRASETLLEKWVEPFSAFARLQVEKLEHSNPPTFQCISNPAQIIHQMWHLLMENHPHDSICGCSIDQVHDEMKVRFDQVDQIGEEITHLSLQSLAGAMDTRSPQPANGAFSAIVVFNPTTTSRTDLAQAEVHLPADVSAFTLVDQQGNSIPFQAEGLGGQDLINIQMTRKELSMLIGNMHEGRFENLSIQDLQLRREGNIIQVEATFGENMPTNQQAWNQGAESMKGFLDDPSVSKFNIHARALAATRLLFSAPDVPGLGWQAYFLQRQAPTPPVRPSSLVWQALAKRFMPREKPPIENEFFRVDVARNGTLTLLDKRNGARYAGLNRFVDGGDCGDEYNFCPPESDLLAAAHLESVTVHRGSIQQAIVLNLEIKTPLELEPDRKKRSKQTIPTKITTLITLTNGVPRVDIHTEVENHARDHRLRVHFPAPLAVDHADHDGHFEIVRRPLGLPDFDDTWVEHPRPEVPQRTFTDVSNKEYGLMIANRGLPEVEVLRRDPVSSRDRVSDKQSEIALTLLRCVGWLSRDDFANRKNHAGPYLPTPGAQMKGKWEFDYSIIPHTGDWLQAYPQAAAFEAPLRAVGMGIHAGGLASTGSFVRVEPQEFVISAVKESEDGRGWIARGYNIAGNDISVRLTPWRSFKKAELVNLAEQKQKALKVAKDGSLDLAVRGHEIVTVLFRD